MCLSESGGAPEDGAALEDEDLPARAGQVRGVGEAVVAATDDDRVIGLGQLRRPPRPIQPA
jgi:hypothetical protein